MSPGQWIHEVLSKHIRCHGFSVAITQLKPPRTTLFCGEANLNAMGPATVTHGGLNFATAHNLLCRFIVFVNDRDALFTAEDDLEQVEVALRPLTQQLTTAMLGSWNARVVQGEAPVVVAEEAAAALLAPPTPS